MPGQQKPYAVQPMMADPTLDARRRAALFLDRAGTCAIVVAMHYNGAGGFLFEDAHPRVLRPLPDAEALGNAVFAAMQNSQVKPQGTHYAMKLTHWPAYTASGARSVSRFEADFIQILVAGANEANTIYDIEGFPEKEAELRVLGTANPRPADQLGERCFAVWRACRDRSV